LRVLTGSSIGKCREALRCEGNDIDRAVKWLRRSGAESVKSRGERVIDQGLVAMSVNDSIGTIVKLNCETDFVARNSYFQTLIVLILQEASTVASMPPSEAVDALKRKKISGSMEIPGVTSSKIGDAVIELSAVLGERIDIGGVYSMHSSERSVIAGYLHKECAAGVGSMGCLICLEAEEEITGYQRKKLVVAARALAMQQSASKTKYVTEECVPDTVLKAEQELWTSAIVDKDVDSKTKQKILEGRTKNFYSENVLMLQEYVTFALSGCVADDVSAPLTVREGLKIIGKSIGVGNLFISKAELLGVAVESK